MSQYEIRLSAGAIEYTRPLTITETTGKDITEATVQLSLGSYDAPGEWRTPDTDTSPSTSSRTVQLLIGDDLKPSAGSYWLWSRVGDTPEVIPRRHDKITIA